MDSPNNENIENLKKFPTLVVGGFHGQLPKVTFATFAIEHAVQEFEELKAHG